MEFEITFSNYYFLFLVTMKILGKKSIRRTIIAIILFVCLLIIGFGFTIVTIKYIHNVKQDMINSITIDARLIGEYCTTALLFNYPDRAEEILIKLKSLSVVMCGVVYDESDQIFATYHRFKKNDHFPELHKKSFYQFDADILHVWEPILYQGKRYGTIYISADTEISQKIQNHMIMISLLTVGMLLLTYLLASNLQKIISRPLLQLIDITKKITKNGDYSIRIPLRRDDEIGQLYKAFNDMIEVIHKRRDEIERENWLKKGQAELNENLRGDQTLESLGKNIINFLAEYLDAQLGTLYLSDKDNSLRLTSTYAIPDNDTIPTQIEPGDGLIGQVALNQRFIHLTDCPDNYIHVSSSLGNVVPNQLLLFPLVYNDSLTGVIELATIHSFEPNKLSFLENVTESIAIAITSIQSRTRMAELLRQTQEQTSELKVREEELSQTNEELEDKNRILEDHKIDIEMKNNELQIAQKVVEEKVQELELTNKYKSEFLANMSHELRTPLNSILLLSKLLADNKEGLLSDDDAESAQTIYKSGAELLNLINDILDLSKVEAGQIDLHVNKTKISTLAENMKKTFEPMAKERNLDFIIDISENIPNKIYTDSQRTEQIVRNFLSNSMKFTSKGSITLKISRPEPSKDITIMLNQNGLNASKTIAFSVIDTGIGISKDKQKIVFEAFQQADGTTSRKYGGTGLGLSISREFSKLLGGIIRVSSELNKGSIFTLYLPEKKKSYDDNSGDSHSFIEDEQDIVHDKQENNFVEEKKSIDSSRIESDKGQKIDAPIIEDDRDQILPEDKSILIIEDDPFFAKLLTNQSRKHNFKVLFADNGELGLQLAEIYLPKAIILDIKLPGINGWKVIETLKKNPYTRHIPINCITGTDDDGQASKKGILTYMIKPVSQSDLDQIYKKVEHVVSKDVKDLLIIEDDTNQAEAIKKLIGNGDVQITVASTGADAIELLGTNKFDCTILDLKLPDISGFELLSIIRQNDTIDFYKMPVIVYTGKDLAKDEINVLEEYAQLTIIKGEKSSQRLLDETTLFLHRVVSDLQEKQKNIISKLHDRDGILAGKTVLIADDDMRNVFSLKKILTEKNIHVHVAKNGKEAIERLYHEPDINLVLMDIMMPEMDGYEAIQKIREDKKYKKLPIIALTAKAMKGDREKCIRIGANDYVSKPINVEKLFSTLSIWLY